LIFDHPRPYCPRSDHEAVISWQVSHGWKKDPGRADFPVARRVLGLNSLARRVWYTLRELLLTKAVASSVLAFTLAVSAPAFASSRAITGEGEDAAVTIQSLSVGPMSADLLMPTPEPASLLLCGSALILFARRIRSKAIDQNRWALRRRGCGKLRPPIWRFRNWTI
jgi:hypothetical protein